VDENDKKILFKKLKNMSTEENQEKNTEELKNKTQEPVKPFKTGGFTKPGYSFSGSRGSSVNSGRATGASGVQRQKSSGRKR